MRFKVLSYTFVLTLQTKDTFNFKLFKKKLTQTKDLSKKRPSLHKVVNLKSKTAKNLL